MTKRTSTLLQEILASSPRNTLWTMSPENKKEVYWSNEFFIIKDDPEMIKLIGGEYIVKNRLKEYPVVHEIDYRENNWEIIGESQSRNISLSMFHRFFPKNIGTLKKFQHLNEIFEKPMKHTIEWTNYIKRIFPDSTMFTDKNPKQNIKNWSYFIESDKIKASVAGFHC